MAGALVQISGGKLTNQSAERAAAVRNENRGAKHLHICEFEIPESPRGLCYIGHNSCGSECMDIDMIVGTCAYVYAKKHSKIPNSSFHGFEAFYNYYSARYSDFEEHAPCYIYGKGSSSPSPAYSARYPGCDVTNDEGGGRADDSGGDGCLSIPSYGWFYDDDHDGVEAKRERADEINSSSQTKRKNSNAYLSTSTRRVLNDIFRSASERMTNTSSCSALPQKDFGDNSKSISEILTARAGNDSTDRPSSENSLDSVVNLHPTSCQMDANMAESRTDVGTAIIGASADDKV
jgi:hypothetical protein